MRETGRQAEKGGMIKEDQVLATDYNTWYAYWLHNPFLGAFWTFMNNAVSICSYAGHVQAAVSASVQMDKQTPVTALAARETYSGKKPVSG